MRKKALVYASVASMIQQFNMENIKILLELGYEVDVACNFEFGNTISNEKIVNLKNNLKEMKVSYYHIPVPRKLTDIQNLKKSYIKTLKLINERKYDLIHCHSPIGGVICRMANRCSTNYINTKMIYTAHGFHFYKGNSKIKNLIFKTIEMVGAKYTDVLITINKEDFMAAKKFKLRRNGVVKYIPGIGIDVKKICETKSKRNTIISDLKLEKSAVLLLSVGELNDNKNHLSIVEILPELPNNYHYLICGQGILEERLLAVAKQLGVENRLHLLGYREDVIEIMKSCDYFVFPSKREGLSVALMEAIASGLPCIASKIRGNIDLLSENKKHLLYNLGETDKIIKYLRKEKENTNIDKKIIKIIDKEYICNLMKKIYLSE